jgi:hypothetical protein
LSRPAAFAKIDRNAGHGIGAILILVEEGVVVAIAAVDGEVWAGERLVEAADLPSAKAIADSDAFAGEFRHAVDKVRRPQRDS